MAKKANSGSAKKTQNQQPVLLISFANLFVYIGWSFCCFSIHCGWAPCDKYDRWVSMRREGEAATVARMAYFQPIKNVYIKYDERTDHKATLPPK